MLSDHDTSQHDYPTYEGDEVFEVTLSEETVAHLETRALAA